MNYALEEDRNPKEWWSSLGEGKSEAEQKRDGAMMGKGDIEPVAKSTHVKMGRRESQKQRRNSKHKH